jgi:polyhydroxyalkanoate synthase subunit PhaC
MSGYQNTSSKWEQNWTIISQEKRVQIIDGELSVEMIQEHRILRQKNNNVVPIATVRSYLPKGPTKPPIILLHGFAQNRYTWQCTHRSASAYFVSLGFDVWNVELRGHGLSRLDGQMGAECFDDYVSDLKNVARALPDSAFWLGHSLGGATIYAAASTMNPLRCRGVIGLGAVFHFAQGNQFLRMICHITDQIFSSKRLGNLQVRTRVGGDFLSSIYGLVDIAGFIFPISGWWPDSIEHHILEERLQKGFDWTSFEVWKEMSKWATTQKFPYQQKWQQINIPLFVILGDCDHLLTPVDGRVAYDLSHSRDKELLLLNNLDHKRHWGHVDITIGKDALDYVWKPIGDWMLKRS